MGRSWHAAMSSLRLDTKKRKIKTYHYVVLLNGQLVLGTTTLFYEIFKESLDQFNLQNGEVVGFATVDENVVTRNTVGTAKLQEWTVDIGNFIFRIKSTDRALKQYELSLLQPNFYSVFPIKNPQFITKAILENKRKRK
jgi:hypothetical protein